MARRIIGWVAPLLLMGALAGPRSGHAAVKCGGQDGDHTYTCSIDQSIDAGALCNDGTQPMFQVRNGSGTGINHWIIWLEGGGSCFDQTSCTLRSGSSQTAPLLTANGFTAQDGVGPLSSSSSINPVMYNANTVVVHYCSSDKWSGDASAAGAFNPTNPATWQFKGRRIVLAAVKSLSELPLNFSKATMIVLGGTSAGGEGISYTVNDIVPILPPAPTILFTNDAGFSIDIGQYDPSSPSPYIYPSASTNAFNWEATNEISLWKGHGDSKCYAKALTQQDQVNCYNSSQLLIQHYITLPAFVAQSQLDTNKVSSLICPYQYGDCAVPTSPSSSQGIYAAADASQMLAALKSSGASFASPDSYMHVVLDNPVQAATPYPVLGGQITPQQVWNAWVSFPKGPRSMQTGIGPGVSGGVSPNYTSRR